MAAMITAVIGVHFSISTCNLTNIKGHLDMISL